MNTNRRLLLLLLAFSFVILSLPVFAQQVIAAVPVGSGPFAEAVNPVTNKIYVVNEFGHSVTVIDGTSFSTTTVPVGNVPFAVGLNSVTNKIYVADYGDDNMTVIDGITNQTTTVAVGGSSQDLAVNPVTNKIYVVQPGFNRVTVVDGATLSTTTVPVGVGPGAVAVNSVTNKIYVVNHGGGAGNTLTVIDGVTLSTSTVTVGWSPYALAVNSVTNKIYVVNECGNDPNCAPVGTVTVVDGVTLSTSTVGVESLPYSVAVNPITNRIYVANAGLGAGTTVTVIDGSTLSTATVTVGSGPWAVAVNSVTDKIYVTDETSASVTMIDGATNSTVTVTVGNGPQPEVVNAVTNRIYVANFIDDTVSVIAGANSSAVQFVPLSQPCRAFDTRPDHGGGGPIQGGTFQNFTISGAGSCPTLPSAAVYSMNVSVVPDGPLGYLTVWPAGQLQPLVSTLNSLDGRIKANAAIVPAGANGQISVYANNTTNVIVDVNGYFAPVSGSTLAFYPLTPYRVADTRHSSYPPGLGPPFLTGGQERDFPILNATTCNIPPTGAVAYSLNFSVVPHGPLGYMTVWPTGESRLTVSTLNDLPGQIIANAAIVAAGTGGEVSVYPTNDTDLIIDINGYFAAAGPGGLSLYGVQPCRVIDTRHVGSGQPFSGTLSPPVDVVDSGCGVSSLAQAYVFNASVVPYGALGYLTLWPDGSGQPLVSTLNALDGSISSNMAIVPTTNGKVDAYASGLTQLILDISSYFAP
jgi:YVTN family beta-propeller protein